MSWQFKRQDSVIGMVAVLAVGLYVGAAATLDAVGFPLDDGWIHQTYARNLADYGEWAFVHGTPSAASTSPLYTVLLALGRVAGIPFFLWTYALGAVALAGAGWLGAHLARVMFPQLEPMHVSLWTGLALVVAWHNVWAAASGMETMIFGALSLGIMALAWRATELGDEDPPRYLKQGAVFGIVGALLTLTRPEGIGLLGLSGAVVVWAQIRRAHRISWKASAWWVSGALFGWVIGVLPYLLLNVHIEGALLPNTSAAKQAEYAVLRDLPLWRRYLRLLLPILIGGQLLLIPGIVMAVWSLFRRSARDMRHVLFLLPAAWAAMLISAYALRLPASYQHGRYVMPALSPLLLYGVGGTLLIVRAAQRTMLHRVVARSLGLAAVGLMIGFLIIGAQQYARDVRIINTEMVASAHWLEDHVPPDELLAVHDIGAVGYYAPRPILDLAGLVSPEVVPIIRDYGALMQLMCERRVAYLMVFPDQLPTEADDLRLGTEWEVDEEMEKRVIAPAFRTDAPYAIEAGGGNMAIYRMNWGVECQ